MYNAIKRGLRRRNYGPAKINSITSFSQLGRLGEDSLMRELLQSGWKCQGGNVMKFYIITLLLQTGHRAPWITTIVRERMGSGACNFWDVRQRQLVQFYQLVESLPRLLKFEGEITYSDLLIRTSIMEMICKQYPDRWREGGSRD